MEHEGESCTFHVTLRFRAAVLRGTWEPEAILNIFIGPVYPGLRANSPLCSPLLAPLLLHVIRKSC